MNLQIITSCLEEHGFMPWKPMVSTYLRMIYFPHQWDIMAIYQLAFFSTDSEITRSIPLVIESLQYYQHVGIGLLKYSSLMGNFMLPPDITNMVASINMILSSIILTDPWIVPESQKINSFCDRMLLSPIELEYESIYLECSENPNIDDLVNWVDHSQDSVLHFDLFDDIFSINKSIMEIIIPN